MAEEQSVIPIVQIGRCIHTVRGQRVILDADLAALYGVETRALIQAVKRNIGRFPKDFMLQMTAPEMRDLRSQSVTSSWGGLRYPPFAFTEQGVAMLSSVLKSERAVKVNRDNADVCKVARVAFVECGADQET